MWERTYGKTSHQGRFFFGFFTNMTKNTKEFINNFILQEKNAIKNIGTFTAVYRHPVVTKYMPKYMHKNLIDKNAYSSLKYLHESSDIFFKSIYHHDEGKTIITSGSTESILLSFYFHREYARKHRGITKPNIVVPKHAHVSIEKCAKILGVEVIKADLNKSYSVDTSDVERKINKNTILIVGVLGTTELGVVDDIQELDIIAIKKNVPLHIDAAIGGFVLPFLNSVKVPYSFSQLKSLSSVNISGHKYGLSLPGCGVLLVKSSNLVLNNSTYFNYLSSGKNAVHTLLITCSSLGAFSLGLNIMEFGKEGYQKNARKYIATKKKMISILDELGIAYVDGSPYLPQLYICPKRVKQVSKKLVEKGWIQSAYKGIGYSKIGIRVVIKKGQENMILRDFMNDLREIVAEQEQVEYTDVTMPNYL